MSATQAHGNIQLQELAGKLDEALKANAEFLRDNTQLRQQADAQRLLIIDLKADAAKNSRQGIKEQIAKMTAEVEAAGEELKMQRLRADAAEAKAKKADELARALEEQLRDTRE